MNSVSRGQWRRSPSTSNPFAVVENGRLLFDSAHAGSYLGDYTFVWSSPDEADQLVAGFYLRVQQAPTETIGFNIASFADRLNPEFQRSRLFIKRGDGDNTFRLGLTASDSRVNEEETNVIFSDFDLAAGVDHLVFLTWDPATLTARMYLNTEFASEPLVQVEGETNRDLRRFAFRTDSSVGVGRYEVHTLRISEDWQTAVLAMRDGLDSGFYDDIVLGRHFRAEGGWVVWQGDNGSPRRGVLWMGNRSSNGTGWVFHTRVGWLHLSGGSMDAGLFAWSVDLGWIYTGGIAGQEWFYRYADDTYQRWVP
ncbi:MAG: hypothetical protein LR015_13660 [Verrucomicrobia bacterium]|nr:hypothetical protein [Verrucomicrobiota bacterium]